MKDEFRKYLLEGEAAGERYSFILPKDSLHGRYGNYAGKSTGTSLDFMDIRDYRPGDDLRHIDWGAFARSDKLVLKLFREEVDPHVDILIDCSRSIALEGSKKERAVLGLSALTGIAALNAGCACFPWMAANGCLRVENGSDRPSAWQGLNFDSRHTLPESFGILPPVWQRRGIRILISDLLFPGDPFTILSHLVEGAAAVIIIQVLAEADLDPPLRGSVVAVDSETGGTVELFFDEQARMRYNESLEAHQQNWHEAALKTGISLVTFTAGQVAGNWDIAPLEAAGVLGAV